MEKKITQVVVETSEFIKQAEACMDQDLKDNFIHYIAKNPLPGDLISGAGGARKVRLAGTNKGKSGGVIYYYYNLGNPIFLFTAYGKNQRANIAMNEKNLLKKIIKSNC